MRVLVACEYSGRVRDAFRAMGHDAWSCDLLPSESRGGPHYQGDILDAVSDDGYFYRHWKIDLLIAHPPCQYLARSGARWWPDRQQEQKKALRFVRWLLELPISKIALENPPGAIGSNIRKADQYIQPWQFGHTEKKMTGLWLKGLPHLKSTHVVKTQMELLPLKDQNRCHYAAPGKERWKERSRTYPGIASAMADQWGW